MAGSVAGSVGSGTENQEQKLHKALALQCNLWYNGPKQGSRMGGKGGGKMMKKRINEMFDLERVRDFTEAHIDEAEWIEGPCGERRRTLVIETLIDSWHGAYIPGMVLELFGAADGYDLEDPYNWEKNETIHDALMVLENEITNCLNKALPSKGTYYVGYHEYDGSYCLFYEEVKQ